MNVYSLLLQDWVTLNGSASSSMVQAEADWLHCPDIQDLVFWLDLRNVVGSPLLAYETAPLREEAVFQPMVSMLTLTSPSSTVVLTPALAGIALVPPSAWVRWRLLGGGAAFNVTFRIHITGNRVGAVARPRPLTDSGGVVAAGVFRGERMGP